jgi:hypothetical protein
MDLYKNHSSTTSTTWILPLRHHQPGPVVCCFTCESEHGINEDQPYTTDALLALHHNDCLWTIALRDLYPCSIDTTPSQQPTRDILTPTPTAPQDRSRFDGYPPENGTYNPEPQTRKQDLPRPSRMPRSLSCPPANTRVSDNPWAERTKQTSATATKRQPPFPITATPNATPRTLRMPQSSSPAPDQTHKSNQLAKRTHLSNPNHSQ